MAKGGGVRVDNEEPALIEWEAPTPPRGHRPWEALLGLALLVAVLGAAGIDGWRTEQARQAYRQGVAAAAARHWDAAAEAFAQAGSYPDAARQYAEAAGQVARRDALLAQAAQAPGPGAAWHALTQAAAIEPDYPGLPAQVDAARRQLFRQGVAGTVFLQTGGTAPGLYLLAGGAPIYLPGSDAKSRLRGRALDAETFLYDRAPGAAPGLCLLACAPGLRQLVLVRGGTAGPLITQVVGGDLPSEGSATFTHDGSALWWSAGGRVWYCDLAHGQITDVLRARPGWRVLALDPARGRMLLAAAEAGAAPRTLLTLADATGQAADPLPPAAPGTILRAMFSADGSHLVYLAQQTTSQTIRALWQVDLQHPDHARHELAWLPWGDIRTVGWLGAFLPPAPAGDAVFIYRLDGSGEQVVRVNLDVGGATLLWSGRARELHGNSAAISPDGHVLALHNARGMAGTLDLVAANGGEPARAFPAPAYGGQSIQAAFTPGGDYVLYTVRNPEGLERGYVQPIYSLPTGAPAGTAPLALARNAVLPYDPSLAALALPPGGELLLYISAGGTLQATTFDGAARATLGSGVDAVWSRRDPGPWNWVR